jgi:hypothetical protein
MRASSSERGSRVRNEGLLRDLMRQTKETTRVLDRRMNTKRDNFNGGPSRYVLDVSRVAGSGSISSCICETLKRSRLCKSSSSLFQREQDIQVRKQNILSARKRRISLLRIVESSWRVNQRFREPRSGAESSESETA